MSMSIDLSELRSSTYHRFTSYTNSFFLLRVPLMINEQLSAIGCSEGMLTLNSRYPSLGITFDSLFKDVNTVVKKYGISELTNYWIEDVPLFKLNYSTPDGMKKFIRSAKMVQNEIASRISARLAVASGFTASHQYSRLPVVVHTEVFLITPDPTGKDADLKLVTSETLSNCIAMHKKSEVFNFGELFRRHKLKGAPTSHQLLEDLSEIVEWYQLGIQLGIPEAELNNIRCRNDKVKGRRCEMLSTWLTKSPQPTWATIINALTGIGRRNLANKMALKYGVQVTSSTETKQVSKQVPEQVPTSQKKRARDSIQQKLSSQVQQLQSGIESKDMELVVSKQTATEAHNARDIARGRLDEVGKKAVEVQTNVILLSKKSSDTRSQLEQKRRNLESLKKRALWKKEEFQGVVDHTNEEIRKLQEELAAIQAELASEKEKARSLPEQLQQAKKELAEKSARVQELESTQQKLETSLENQRERVNQLLMQESVASDLQQHNTEIKHQLITAKKELEAKAAEVANLKETVAFQDGEVKRLSAELRSREALLQPLLTQLSQVTKPDHAQELKSKEELQRLTEEVSELRAKLFRAEDAKQEAQRQMEAAELKSRLLQEIVRESMQTPPPVLPKPAQKPAQASELSGPGKNTWEYKVFSGNSAEIVDKLANVRLADRVASKLSAAGIIGESVTEHVYNYGPGITERSRLQHIITALKDKIQLDARRYHEFRNVLLLLGPDTEAAIHYIPETDPTVQKYTAMKARTPSKDQDPTVHKSTPEKARTPSKDQGHATGQQQITIRGIQWRTGKATPESMYRGAAISHGKMAYFNSDDSTSVYSYDSQGQLWQWLPSCHSRNSALVMADNKLTTVGGRDQDSRPTNSLASLTGEGKDSKWVELFPRMPTARYHLAAVCRGRNVIAAGGSDGGRTLSTVEILDTDLRQWSSATSLPHPMSQASITVCGDLLYLLGGWDQNDPTLSVLTSSIADLLHQQQETANQLAVWRRAADAAYYVSTVVSVGGQLLAIGGCDEAYKNTSAIVAYDPTSDSWQDMGHMTTPRYCPLVALLPSNELIVAGGVGGEKKVEIGNVV